MTPVKMHDGEVGTNPSLVHRLLAAQFPQWADLPIKPVASAGTDNALYRLGDDMAVRLPRIDWTTEQVDKEHQWLPRLAPFLPLAIPVPLVKGNPARAIPGIGQSIGGSMARTRPSSASPIRARRRLTWRNSLPPCSGSTPLAGRPPGPTACLAVSRWQPEIRSLARQLQPCEARLMPMQSPPYGMRQSRRRHGTAHLSGCMPTCNPETCWLRRGGSAPSLISGV